MYTLLRISFLLLLVAGLAGAGHCKEFHLKGQFPQQEKSVRLLLLIGDNYYSQPMLQLPLDAKGQLDTKIPLEAPVFGMIYTGNKHIKILLWPGSDLQMEVKESEKNPFFSGSSADVNLLVNIGRLNNPPRFLMTRGAGNPFAALSYAEWQRQVNSKSRDYLPTLERDLKTRSIPEEQVKLILSEQRYANFAYEYTLVHDDMLLAKNPDRDSILDAIMLQLPLPGKEELRSGCFANAYLSSYINYQFEKLLRNRNSGNEAALEKQMSAMLKKPLTEIKEEFDMYGSTYLLKYWYAAANLKPIYAEKVLFNSLLAACTDKAEETAGYLLDTMKARYPKSSYLLQAGEIVAMAKADQAEK